MKILTQDAIVMQILERIAKTLTDSGAQINDALCIHQSGQNFWATCTPLALGQNLFSIPSELLIPVTQLQWQVQLGKLYYSGDTTSLSPVQHGLLDDMILLYNQVDKVSQAIQTLPSLQLKYDPILYDWVPTIHTTFMLDRNYPAEQFIDTRLIELEPENKNGTLERCLMPLVDLLDNHPYAPKFDLTEGCLRIAVAFPVEASNKCFVRYSKADCLSIAIWHGYFDPYTQHIASLDCTLEHTELGSIRIFGTNASRRKISAPRLLPGEPVLTLQDLVLEKEQLPSLRTLLGLAVRSKRRDLGQLDAEKLADELIQMLIDANIRKYTELQELCTQESHIYPLRLLFGQVAQHQLALLHALRAR